MSAKLSQDISPDTENSSSSSSTSSVILHNLFTAEGGVIAAGVAAQAHPLAGGGFGVIASSKLRSGQTVASVPQNLWVTAANSRKAEGLTKKAVDSPVAAICIRLVRERLRAIEEVFEQVGGDLKLILDKLVSQDAACRGFSLSHVKIVDLAGGLLQTKIPKQSKPLSMMREWVRRLPSQYDNLIQFAPHLEYLKRGDFDGAKFEVASKVFHQSVEKLIREHFPVDDGDETPLDEDSSSSSKSESRKPQQSSLNSVFGSSTAISIGLQRAYGLPQRYADKTEVEIARWRKLAQDHLPFLRYASWSSNDDKDGEINQASSSTLQILPPIITSVFNQHRKNLCSEKARSNSDFAANVVADYFSDERMLIELFSWAYSSLMSRGFSHDDEVWLMQPWVDYFNYSPASTYNVSAQMNHQSCRFEFKARELIKPGTELCLHYGTYSDFEIALWYGFTLCQFGAGLEEGKKNEKDEDKTEDTVPSEHHHQSDCEYVFSPLSGPDGEYSAEEFRRFVVQVVMIAVQYYNNNNHHMEDAPQPSSREQNVINQIAMTICKKMITAFGVGAPRCAFKRDGLVANETFQFLCRKVCENISSGGDDSGEDDDEEIIEDENETKNSKNQMNRKQNNLTQNELIKLVIRHELSSGVFNSSTVFESTKELDTFVNVCASDLDSPCSKFARLIGRDVRDLLSKI